MITNTNLASAILNLPLKEMDGTLLSFAIMHSVDANTDGLREALELSAFLHRGATRANRGVMPRDHYVTHPLRNTLRLIRWGVTDRDILVASLLHDTVEDCAPEILSLAGVNEFEDETEAALSVITARFGAEVGRILRGVTNPSFEEGLSRKEKHQVYRQHVIESVEDSDVLLVKFSDFVDNAGSLHYNVSSSSGMVKNLAAKYHPLVEPLRSRLNRFSMDGVSTQELVNQLNRIDKRLTELASL